MSTELAVVPVATQAMTVSGWAPSPLAEMTEEMFAKRLEMMKLERSRILAVQKAVMREGVDYGAIPGTGDKRALLKPGAEIFNKMAGIVPMVSYTVERGDGISAPSVNYVVKCQLRRGSEDGPLVAEGVGSCNSWEKKYRYRKSERECPDCKQPAIIKSKFGGEGWFCFQKKGGCGAKFALRDAAIEGQVVGMIENLDPYEFDNTCLKMAKKRAFVDATLTGHALSGIMTQDIEDDGQEEPSPPPRKQTKAPQRSRAAPVRHDRDGVVAEQEQEQAPPGGYGGGPAEPPPEDVPEWMGEDSATQEAAEKLRSVDRAKRELSLCAQTEMQVKRCESRRAVEKAYREAFALNLAPERIKAIADICAARCREIEATQPLGKPAGEVVDELGGRM